MEPKPELVAAQRDRIPRGTEARRGIVGHEDVIAVAHEAAEPQVPGEQMGEQMIDGRDGGSARRPREGSGASPGPRGTRTIAQLLGDRTQ